MSSCLMFGKCNRGWSDAYVAVAVFLVEAERFGLINQHSLAQLGRMGGRWSWHEFAITVIGCQLTGGDS